MGEGENGRGGEGENAGLRCGCSGRQDARVCQGRQIGRAQVSLEGQQDFMCLKSQMSENRTIRDIRIVDEDGTLQNIGIKQSKFAKIAKAKAIMELAQVHNKDR